MFNVVYLLNLKLAFTARENTGGKWDALLCLQEGHLIAAMEEIDLLSRALSVRSKDVAHWLVQNAGNVTQHFDSKVEESESTDSKVPNDDVSGRNMHPSTMQAFHLCAFRGSYVIGERFFVVDALTIAWRAQGDRMVVPPVNPNVLMEIAKSKHTKVLLAEQMAKSQGDMKNEHCTMA